MNRQELVTFYRNNGMGVFPLIGKIPMIKKWQEIDVHSVEAYSHKGGLGANLPNDIVVIDIDPRNFPKDEKTKKITNSAMELFNACGITKPHTLKVITGSGGLHIYFRKPADVLCKKNLDKDGFPGIDVKTRNGNKGAYVVMPTSIHPKTKKEYVMREECTEILDIPKTLLDIITRPKPVESVVRVDDGREFRGETESGKKIFVDWLTKSAPVAIEGNAGDQTTFDVACVGRDYGLDITNTYFCMLEYWNDRCDPPWGEDELIAKVTNAFEYATGAQGAKNAENMLDDLDAPKSIVINWDFQGDGSTLKKSLFNTVNFFNLPAAGLRELLRYNEFTQKVEFTKCPPWQTAFLRETWGDADITACRYYLSDKFSFEVPASVIDEAANVLAMQNRIHPVRDYLNNLVWDGKQRINSWLPKYGNVPTNAFSREVGRKLLVGAVSRIFDPGCKFDYVTVLEGNQGYFKSTLISILGGEWYAEIDIDPRSKDIVHVMNGKWFIELSEMETSRKSEADALKSFITRQTDRIRLPYDRYATDIKRQCIFIGTINPQIGVGYLKDTTGNRRFWCLEVAKHCDTEGLRLVRDQLFAEAVQIYRQGELLFLDKQEIDEYARLEADKRAGGDPWQTTIASTLAADPTLKEITPMNIYGLALGGKPIDFNIRENVRIQRAMAALGWKYEIITRDEGYKEGVFRKG